MPRLSTLRAPALAGVVRERTCAAAAAEIRSCLYDGADMIDLHISCLEDATPDALRRVIGISPLPVLALHYNRTCEWADAGASEEERTEALLRAVEAGAAGIDMQGYTFHAPSRDAFCGEDQYSFTKPAPREVVTDAAVIERQCALIERVHGMGAEVLISCHPGVAMSCEQVVDLALFLVRRGPDIIKIVTVGKDEDDLTEGFRTMAALKREVRTPVSFHVGGRACALSRIVNPMLGGQILFCVDRYGPNSTLEQPELRTARAVVDGIRKML